MYNKVALIGFFRYYSHKHISLPCLAQCFTSFMVRRELIKKEKVDANGIPILAQVL